MHITPCTTHHILYMLNIICHNLATLSLCTIPILCPSCPTHHTPYRLSRVRYPLSEQRVPGR
ncbi:hypothetical protein EON63_24740 [archaeon]|nr:MAG: hypothetical protein EON63_24740 [archaeon]